MLVKFGEFILKSRQNSIVLALLFSFLPFFSWISNVIVALVTLRKGVREGVWVLLWASLPDVLLLIYGDAAGVTDSGHSQLSFYLYALFGSNLYSMLMACVLRQWASWARVLEANLLLGFVVIVIVHLAVPGIAQYWQALYSKALTDLSEQTGTGFNLLGVDNATDREQLVAQMQAGPFLGYLAKITTGILLGLLIVSGLIKLALARWWQALLFNPGGLRIELHNIRLSTLASLLLLACVVMTFAGYSLVVDFLPVIVVVFFLAGLSFVHWQAARMKSGTLLLAIFYLVLILFSGYILDYVLVALVMMAMVDSCIDLRRRIGLKSTLR